MAFRLPGGGAEEARPTVCWAIRVDGTGRNREVDQEERATVQRWIDAAQAAR